VKFDIDKMWLIVQTSWRIANEQQDGNASDPDDPLPNGRGWDMDKIESLLQRPKFYNNVDGVGELGVGVMLLSFGLLQWLQANSPHNAIWHKFYVALPLILLMASIIDWGSKAIKKHITYPRTGFVEYKKRDTVRAGAVAFVVSALVAMGLAIGIRTHWGIDSHWRLAAPTALFGLLFAASYAYGIARSVLWKWVVVGAIAICSFVIAMLPAELLGAMAGSGTGGVSAPAIGAWLLSILSYAAILLTSGGLSFVFYLRHTQPPAEAAQ
jgi:hypothetical protein